MTVKYVLIDGAFSPCSIRNVAKYDNKFSITGKGVCTVYSIQKLLNLHMADSYVLRVDMAMPLRQKC